MGLPRNPRKVENIVNDANNTLPTPKGFDLDGHTTPNDSNMVILKEEEDKQPKTTASEII